MMASLLFGLASATTSNSAGNMARAYVGTLLVGLASATTSNSAGNMARAYVGTLRLNVSDNSYAAADSVLPFFQFMNSGNEGGIGFAFPPADKPKPAMHGLQDWLPDYMLNETHVMADLRDRMLPWRMKDGWTQERVEPPGAHWP